MEGPLNGPNRPAQCFGQGLHLGPAQPRLIVGVVGEGAVGRDGLGGDSGVGEVLDLGDTGKLGLLWHRCLLFLVRRCALMIEFTKTAGALGKEFVPPPFFFFFFFSILFFWCVLYLHGHPRASPCRDPGPFLFPERFVQFAAPPHLVHRRGNIKGPAPSHSAGPSFCAIAPVLTAQSRTIVPLPHSRLYPLSSNCLVLRQRTGAKPEIVGATRVVDEQGTHLPASGSRLGRPAFRLGHLCRGRRA